MLFTQHSPGHLHLHPLVNTTLELRQKSGNYDHQDLFDPAHKSVIDLLAREVCRLLTVTEAFPALAPSDIHTRKMQLQTSSHRVPETPQPVLVAGVKGLKRKTKRSQ